MANLPSGFLLRILREREPMAADYGFHRVRSMTEAIYKYVAPNVWS